MKLLIKLLEHYSETDIKEKIDKSHFSNMKSDKKFTSLDTVAKSIDIKKINYNIDDFIDDYPQYKKHKEIKTIYNIQIDGETVSGLSDRNKCSTLFSHIKDGFDYNSNDYINKGDVLKYFDFEIDLSNFKTKIFKRHTELYGDKEALELIRDMYKITHPVSLAKEKDTWHLAFDGMLNDWIREIYIKEKAILI